MNDVMSGETYSIGAGYNVANMSHRDSANSARSSGYEREKTRPKEGQNSKHKRGIYPTGREGYMTMISH
jgi:hypothetical protein